DRRGWGATALSRRLAEGATGHGSSGRGSGGEQPASHVSEHLARHRQRIRRVADRPADDEIVRPGAHRLARGQHALLIVERGGGLPDARRDDHEPRPSLSPDAGDLEGRGAPAVTPGAPGDPRGATPLVLDVAVDADEPQVAPREAGQHRDGEDAWPPEALAAADARHLLARPRHHLQAARRVYVEEADAQ